MTKKVKQLLILFCIAVVLFLFAFYFSSKDLKVSFFDTFAKGNPAVTLKTARNFKASVTVAMKNGRPLSPEVISAIKTVKNPADLQKVVKKYNLVVKGPVSREYCDSGFKNCYGIK